MLETPLVTDHVIAVFLNDVQVESALKALRNARHLMDNVSIIGPDYPTNQRPVGVVALSSRMRSLGKHGAFWTSCWSILSGSAMVVVPGVGFVMFGGWLSNRLENLTISSGSSIVQDALGSVGIPSERVADYESALKTGRFLLFVHGTETEVRRAKALLGASSASAIDLYHNRKIEHFAIAIPS